MNNRLPHMGALRFVGPDAVAFLQGQVSNDTAPLSQGIPVLAAHSTPQGRVLAVLHLLPHSSGIIGILPRDIAAATRDRLRKYVLRSKVAIEDVSAQIAVSGVDAGALAAAGFGAAPAAAEYREQDGVGVAAVRRDGAPERYWMVGDAAAIPSSDNVQADTVERAWRLGDIREGSPQVYAATSELFVAQMLNLDLIGGISFDKGCYSGQEIIARTQHLGRIKRRMSRLRLPPGSWSIGQPLRLEDGRTGRLTEVAPSAEGFEALAVLSLDPGSADGEGGAERALAAEELPLPYRTG
jgi:folate-binding protein YgfZ